MKITSCRLECINGSHPPIALPHQQAVLIGRSLATQIRDTRCSKKQVELTADWNSRTILVRQHGSHPSSVNENEISKDETHTMKEKDRLCILEKLYPHRIVFEKDHGSEKTVNKTGLENANSKTDGKRKNSNSPNSQGVKRKKSEGCSPEEKRKNFFQNSNSPNSQGVKRKMSDGCGPEEKRRKTEGISDSESEDEERKAYVQAQLKLMKQNMGETSQPQEKCEKPKSSPTKLSTQKGEPTQAAQWKSHNNKLLIHTSKGVQASAKIAGFDMDGTIICTQSGKRFPTDYKDWKIKTIEIFSKLKKLISSGYKVVFFTNQLGIGKGRQNESEFKTKVESIIKKLDIPIQVLIAKYGDIYRKPAPGMWRYLAEQGNDDIPIDHEQSFYVGDAAGRPANWTPKAKKDFSKSDRLFALNMNLPFHSPEEFFLKYRKAPFDMPEFDPRNLSKNAKLTDDDSPIAADHQELIVNVGFPASGKSFISKEFLVPKGYTHVSRDQLGSWQKCVAKCRQALSQGSSVVVDNTSPDVESRSRYVDVAKELKVHCRCFRFTASFLHSKHNEKFREMTDSNHQAINDMVMNSYKSKFTEPATSEGFSKVVKINFVPKFKKKEHEELYRMFLLEK